MPLPFYKRSLELSPRYLPALNNLAFLLATSEKHGDPVAALALANRAAVLTNYQHAAILDTLTSVQLAGKDTAGALATLDKAIKLAAKNNQKTLLLELRKKVASLRK